jgi:thiol-disulfide isomerase/thioredoxin
MQLVLHAPFGSRINRAWGLALRKKFCQGFNFELQAAATEEGVILSLGEVHSFPLEEVFRYLHPNGVRDTLLQALLQSPIFETRWRWCTTLALAVPRNRGGARIPNQLQRMYAEDLLQAVFPDAVACQDNIQGAREIPDHPLVNQALRDALEEAVDAGGLEQVLQRLVNGEIGFVARDTPEPSVLSHEQLNSAVYTFLDDAPLEERRTRAVYTRRATELRNADDDPATLAEAEGKSLLVDIWATWCAPCVKELPTLQAVAARAGAPRVIAVSQDMAPRGSVDAFLDKNKLADLEVWHDPKMALSSATGAEVLPTTILYDAKGQEVWRYVGDLDWTGDEAIKLLAEAGASSAG